MDHTTHEVIEDILAGCEDNVDGHRRYLTRTCWRVEGDFAFLRKAVPHPGSVLDIGAAPPLLAGLLAHGGLDRLAVIDPKVGVFAPFFEKHGIQFFEGDVLSADRVVLPAQYELVCFCEVLEHLAGDILSTLETIAQWVAPGGYLYVTTPNLRSISGAVAVFVRGSGLASKSREPVRNQYTRARGAYGYFGHVREYTPKEVRDLIEGLGFHHVESRFQVHPRAETPGAKVIQILETAFPRLRLFGKYLFQKKA